VYFQMLIRLLRDIWSSRRSGDSGTSNAATPGPRYSPAIFHADDLETAKAIILNPMPDMTTDERWEVETQNLVEELGRVMNLSTESRILDYGCGIGRVAKALIDRYGCSVVGVDISAEMRRFAVDYVNSDRFLACEPAALDRTIAEGFRATGAYACWVLQHCHAPAQDIGRIESALAPGALFFVLNSDHRWVPTDRGWVADGISVEELLVARFEAISKTGVSNLVGSKILADQSYGMLLKVRARVEAGDRRR
jgi:SAM-dependent methyltransferase